MQGEVDQCDCGWNYVAYLCFFQGRQREDSITVNLDCLLKLIVIYDTVITLMDWDKTLRLLAAIFGVLGSGVVAYNVMAVTPEDLLPRVVTFYDYNTHLIDVVA